MLAIFIDIDGVLNRFEKLTDPGIPNHKWDPETLGLFGITLEIFPELVEKLNAITDATGALLVLSSSWRKGYLADYADVVTKLKDAGVKAFITGRTPWGDGMKCRGEEIQRWVAEHTDEIESFIILDDFADMGPVLDRLIQTDHDVGLTDEHVKRAIKMLNEQGPKLQWMSPGLLNRRRGIVTLRTHKGDEMAQVVIPPGIINQEYVITPCPR